MTCVVPPRECGGLWCCWAPRSDSAVVGFARPDADGVFDRRDENLAIPDLTRAGGAHDGLNGLVHGAFRHHHLDFDLGQETDGVFGAAVNFRVPLLPPVTLDLG